MAHGLHLIPRTYFHSFPRRSDALPGLHTQQPVGQIRDYAFTPRFSNVPTCQSLPKGICHLNIKKYSTAMEIKIMRLFFFVHLRRIKGRWEGCITKGPCALRFAPTSPTTLFSERFSPKLSVARLHTRTQKKPTHLALPHPFFDKRQVSDYFSKVQCK